MVSVTGTTLITLLNATGDISVNNAEVVIDVAIHCLNLYGADLPNMTGSVGGKTVALESKEAGAVLMTASEIFFSLYRGKEQPIVSGLTVVPADVLSNPAVLEEVKQRARQLAEFDVSSG